MTTENYDRESNDRELQQRVKTESYDRVMTETYDRESNDRELQQRGSYMREIHEAT